MLASTCALLAASSSTASSSTSPSRDATTAGGWNATIVVGTHHKTGTVLLAKAFRVAAKLMGVPRAKSNHSTLSSGCSELLERRAAGVCIIEHVTERDVRSWVRPGLVASASAFATSSFVHAVRDPLEMCVSAYQYHTQGAEPWLTKPMRDLNGSTLQEYYRALTPEAGVRFECKRMVLELVETALVFNATRFSGNSLTVRLEDFGRDYDGAFRRLFSFLGSGARTEALVKAVAPYDLARAPAEDARHSCAGCSITPVVAVQVHAENHTSNSANSSASC